MENGLTERKVAYHFVFTCAEVISMLKNAGFESIDMFSDPTGKEFKIGDKQAYLVAIK